MHAQRFGQVAPNTRCDLPTLWPCFRAMNDLACLLAAAKRYGKGISLEELVLIFASNASLFYPCKRPSLRGH